MAEKGVYDMDLQTRITEKMDAIIRDIQDLIAIKSVGEPAKPGMPFGEGCARALEAALAMGESLGFRSKNLDNYAGYLEMGEGEELIGILTHVDVVPEGDVSHWHYPPYGHTFENGRIYGRGASDNKGPTILAMYAMALLRDMGVPLHKRIRLIIGANEETGFRCMEHYNEVEEPITMGFSPDARFPVIFAECGAYGLQVTAKLDEGRDALTLLKLYGGCAANAVSDKCTAVLRGDRARLQEVAASFAAFAAAHDMRQETALEGDTLTLTLHGKIAHASIPWCGVNANCYLLEFLGGVVPASPFVRGYNELIGTDYYGGKCGVKCEDAYGPLSLCNGTIEFDETTGCSTADLDIRFPVTVDFDRDYAPGLVRRFEDAGFRTTYTGTDRAVYVDPESDFIKALHSAYVEATGDTTHKPQRSSGGTYAKSFSNCVAYGIVPPDEPDPAHLADEYITTEHIEMALKVFVAALQKLLAL